MRTLFKHFVIETISLYFVSQIAVGIVFEFGTTTLLFAGLALMILSAVIKPVINILLLPLNLVTFGIFKWIGVVIILYLVTLVVPGFEVHDFQFLGLNSYWLDIPAITIVGFYSYIAFSFLISIISSIIGWIFK